MAYPTISLDLLCSSHIVHYTVQLEALGDCSVELGPKPGRALGPMRPSLRAWASILQSPSPQKPGLGRGFRAGPGPAQH
jgi:hypothetical protein